MLFCCCDYLLNQIFIGGVGEDGVPGMPGVPGLDGAKGLEGALGDVGEAGPEGAEGPEGRIKLRCVPFHSYRSIRAGPLDCVQYSV